MLVLRAPTWSRLNCDRLRVSPSESFVVKNASIFTYCVGFYASQRETGTDQRGPRRGWSGPCLQALFFSLTAPAPWQASVGGLGVKSLLPKRSSASDADSALESNSLDLVLAATAVGGPASGSSLRDAEGGMAKANGVIIRALLPKQVATALPVGPKASGRFASHRNFHARTFPWKC